MNRHAKLILKRLVALPVSLLVVVTIAFALVVAMPGDPAVTIAGAYASPEVLAEIRAELGIDQPIVIRYLSYLQGVLSGDLGTSFVSRGPVGDELLGYLPNTITLVVLGMALAALLGIAIGVVGAYFRDRFPDRVVQFTITAAQSVPLFVVGLLLIYVLFYTFDAVPAPVGMLKFSERPPAKVTGFLLVDALLAGDTQIFVSAVNHLILPVLTLALVYLAFFAKVTRSTLAEAMASPQVEFARACGLPEWRVVWYGLLSARTPIMTYGAIVFAQVVGSATVVELIFAWPGVSLWGLHGILNVDVPVIQGFVLYAGIATTVTFLILDVVVAMLDPRISYE